MPPRVRESQNLQTIAMQGALRLFNKLYLFRDRQPRQKKTAVGVRVEAAMLDDEESDLLHVTLRLRREDLKRLGLKDEEVDELIHAAADFLRPVG